MGVRVWGGVEEKGGGGAFVGSRLINTSTLKVFDPKQEPYGKYFAFVPLVLCKRTT